MFLYDQSRYRKNEISRAGLICRAPAPSEQDISVMLPVLNCRKGGCIQFGKLEVRGDAALQIPFALVRVDYSYGVRPVDSNCVPLLERWVGEVVHFFWGKRPVNITMLNRIKLERRRIIKVELVCAKICFPASARYHIPVIVQRSLIIRSTHIQP